MFLKKITFLVVLTLIWVGFLGVRFAVVGVVIGGKITPPPLVKNSFKVFFLILEAFTEDETQIHFSFWSDHATFWCTEKTPLYDKQI